MIELKPAINEVKLTLKSISSPINLGTVVEPVSGGSVPTEVRQAIYTLLENAAYATTGLEDEIAIVQAWAQEVTALTIEPNRLDLNNDTPQQIIAVVVPSGTIVNWSSSDESVATVADGIVTGTGNGSCVITATAGNKTANCLVNVSGFATLESISAVYTPSGVVSDTDSLDSLKTDLVVTALWSDETQTTIASDDYTLSGTLEAGTSTITVTYATKTTTFTVVVKHNTTAVVEYSNYCLEHFNNPSRVERSTRTNAGVTKAYDLDSATTAFNFAGIIPYAGSVFQAGYCCLAGYNSGSFVNYVDERITNATRWAQPASGTLAEYQQAWTINTYNQVIFTVDIRYLDDAYMYHGVTGQVFFAGKNTPYYGMSNISEAQ